MNVLMLEKFVEGSYRIIHQRGDLRSTLEDYRSLGIFNGWDIRSHACPAINSNDYDPPRVYIRGVNCASDDKPLSVPSSKVKSFEKAILEFNQKYSNNKLDMEDVIR